MAKKKLGEKLIEAGLLTPEQRDHALAEQRRSAAPLGVVLVRLGMVEETDLLLTLSHQLGAPAAQLDDRRIPADVIARVPLDVADQYHCIPLFERGEAGGRRELFLAMADPTDLPVLDELSFRLGCRIRPVLSLHGQLTDAIDRHYRGKRCAQEHVARDMEAFAPEIALEQMADLAAESESSVQAARAVENAAPRGEAVFEPVRTTDLETAGGAPSARAVLRALIELLVERGILGPDDIAEQLRRRRTPPS